MHPRAIWAIARKDALDLLLNKSTLGGLLFPILLSLVWLLISKVVGNYTTDILVYNPGGSGVTQVVMAAFPSPEVIQAGSAEEVAAAFGPTGTRKTTRYAVGLVVPTDLDDSLRSGAHPQLQLYLDGSTVNAQTEALMQAAIANYGRATANPQPPVDLSTTVIGRRSKTAVFNTVSAAAAVEGPVMLIYILAGIFVGPLGQLLSNSPALQIAKLLPTYYIAEGAYNASQSLGSFGSNVLDSGVILGSTVVLLVVSAWVLRRQSAVAAVI